MCKVNVCVILRSNRTQNKDQVNVHDALIPAITITYPLKKEFTTTECALLNEREAVLMSFSAYPLYKGSRNNN